MNKTLKVTLLTFFKEVTVTEWLNLLGWIVAFITSVWWGGDSVKPPGNGI
jgi:hypothetical protein